MLISNCVPYRGAYTCCFTFPTLLNVRVDEADGTANPLADVAVSVEIAVRLVFQWQKNSVRNRCVRDMRSPNSPGRRPTPIAKIVGFAETVECSRVTRATQFLPIPWRDSPRITTLAAEAASERFRRLIGRLTALLVGGDRGAGGGTVNSRDSAMVVLEMLWIAFSILCDGPWPVCCCVCEWTNK